MRTGLSTIQQTLMAEAASVLSRSILEASRRNHGQTTPLHVAATLLSSPSGFLRQACIRSHPNSSHPLQCRALELCFSVALERLPTSSSSPATEPPMSNALMAALKRAQAHQRRGCPEQQQPLLAVKVELEQLIISILDDPSVSRVMREASFSSPAVKATIERSLLPPTAVSVNQGALAAGFRPSPTPIPIPNRSFCLNPRLHQYRSDELNRIRDLLMRSKKRNPVLVGESGPEALVSELLMRIERGEVSEGPLRNVTLIRFEKEFQFDDHVQVLSKIKGLGDVIGRTRSGDHGVLIYLGDLKWLVEPQKQVGFLGGGGWEPQPVASSEVGRAAVAEIGKILASSDNDCFGRVWVIGTATCETYLRCQVYHPTMESEWDLQAVPIAPRSPLSGIFTRKVGANGITASGSVADSWSSFKSLRNGSWPENACQSSMVDRRRSCCTQCSQKYERELEKFVAEESVKSPSQVDSNLPRWLQSARTNNVDPLQTEEQEMMFKQKSEELQIKWSEKCHHLHSDHHPGSGEATQLNSYQESNQISERSGSSPGSPVRTELVLGRPNSNKAIHTRNAREEHADDLVSCISSRPQNGYRPISSPKTGDASDSDSFKMLLKALMERAWWQPEAACTVARAVTRCRVGKLRSRGDMWLLFTGPDIVGKKKVASALSDHFNGGTADLITVDLAPPRGDIKELGANLRGKTVVDRMAEAVQRDPFSVIMLENVDEADVLVQGSIKSAMERGRLSDSHGREVSLGNVIFIVAGNWSSTKYAGEQKPPSLECGGWQLKLTVGRKRKPNRNYHGRAVKRQIRNEIMESSSSGLLCLDLNLTAGADDDDGADVGSHNSSDLTVDHDNDDVLENGRWLFSITSLPHELVTCVEDTALFKPVDFASVSREIERTIKDVFSSVVDGESSMEVEANAVERILGGVWHGNGQPGLSDWVDRVVGPTFRRLNVRLESATADERAVVRLVVGRRSGGRLAHGEWLPSKIAVLDDDDGNEF